MFNVRHDRILAQEREAAAKQQLLETQEATIKTLETYNTAFSRFVPREFLAHLERPDVALVALGDHIQREMTILFSDIRSFTTLSETMPPEGVFAFLNAYLAHAGPIVRARGGFIDKYVGDAIMALFAGPVDEAVSAAIDLQAEVRRFNMERARHLDTPIAIGVGIHCGPLILGTVGEPERFDTTVIADAVNVASRIEGLTKVYKAPILISGEVVSRLKEPQSFHFRWLGTTQPRGAVKSIDLYEVLDADDPKELLAKINSYDHFKGAVVALESGDGDAAALEFERIVANDPTDDVAKILLAKAYEMSATRVNARSD
jgi:class 3 adenylate cyclase